MREQRGREKGGGGGCRDQKDMGERKTNLGGEQGGALGN